MFDLFPFTRCKNNSEFSKRFLHESQWNHADGELNSEKGNRQKKTKIDIFEIVDFFKEKCHLGKM